ncbi:MAG: ChbG/HpnK family deacetylase [Alphaproteobacteria bacterium]|nr:ChbG/HpnK family deacetylase [Alphaproteobacteria bacterium]
MAALRKIVLCADDYGLSPGVSRGIRELLAAHRLSATSCMTVHPEFDDDGQRLREFCAHTDIGLHFTLTHDRSLSSVLLAGWLRRLNEEKIRDELNRQIERFIKVVGTSPAYIDGHQHVHLLPGVREAVVEAAKRIGAYVRSTGEPIGAAMLKRPAPVDSLFLSLSAGALARQAQRAGVRANSGFRGVRSFKEHAPYRELFRAMIADAANGSIIMCHPGHVDELLRARDPIHRQREEEFAYLASADFLRDMNEAGLKIATLREAVAPP